jgi:hypothetical protein
VPQASEGDALECDRARREADLVAVDVAPTPDEAAAEGVGDGGGCSKISLSMKCL